MLLGRLQSLVEEEYWNLTAGSGVEGIAPRLFLLSISWSRKPNNIGQNHFISCADLKKAYDSVPRSTLWIALSKLGVPERTVCLIRSFHENESSGELDIKKGKRQWCCMACTCSYYSICTPV